MRNDGGGAARRHAEAGEDGLGGSGPVECVEVQPGYTLSEQPFAQLTGNINTYLAHRGRIVTHCGQPVTHRYGMVHPDSSAILCTPRSVVIGMIPGRIGTVAISAPAAATRSLSLR